MSFDISANDYLQNSYVKAREGETIFFTDGRVVRAKLNGYIIIPRETPRGQMNEILDAMAVATVQEAMQTASPQVRT